MKQEMVVLMGLPGSGKSSFYRLKFSSTHKIVSKDLMKNKKHKWLVQDKQIRKFLEEGRSIVIDNTNMTREARKELVQLGHEYNVPVCLYYFPLSVEESMQRNIGQGRTAVPPVAIYTAQKKLELPSRDENFDELYNVWMINPQHFEVTPFQ